jgi:hypothetical protein
MYCGCWYCRCWICGRIVYLFGFLLLLPVKWSWICRFFGLVCVWIEVLVCFWGTGYWPHVFGGALPVHTPCELILLCRCLIIVIFCLHSDCTETDCDGYGGHCLVNIFISNFQTSVVRKLALIAEPPVLHRFQMTNFLKWPWRWSSRSLITGNAETDWMFTDI